MGHSTYILYKNKGWSGKFSLNNSILLQISYWSYVSLWYI